MPDVAVADDDSCVHLGCTGVSSQLAEPLLGTAPHARAWLLLVHPGPWPRSAPAGLLDSVLTDELERRCAAYGVRMAAIRRRHDADGTTPYLAESASTKHAPEPYGPTHMCYIASTRPRRAWLQRIPLTELKDLLDLDLGAIADGVPPSGGERIDGPLYAVCTHGKRDTCCAVNGRPVHRVLSRLAPGDAWEATHLGGHRFAANMLVLPEGLLYGRIDTDNVGDIVDRHARDEIVLDLWRGRSAMPQQAQAAEWFARRATGLMGVDDVALTHIARGDIFAEPGSANHAAEPYGPRNCWRADLVAGDRRLTVVVEQIATGCTRLTGCAGDAADPGRWRLVSLRSA